VKRDLELLCGGSTKDHNTLASILAMRPCSSLEEPYILSWDHDPKGVYSITLSYHFLEMQREGNVEFPWWQRIWNKFG